VIDTATTSSTWSRLNERIGVTLWASFLTACLETVVVFAYFDPAELGRDQPDATWLAVRPVAYGAGFFFFWIINFLGSVLTAYMLDSSPNAAPPSREPRK
jgi:hypothetical protein